MPSHVRNFLVLAYLSLVMGLGELMVSMDGVVNPTPLAGGSTYITAAKLVAAAFITIYGGLIALAGFGRRDWARWVLLTLFAFGLVFDILSLPDIRFSASDAFSWAGAVLEGAALYFAFTGDAKDWYRKEEPAIS